MSEVDIDLEDKEVQKAAALIQKKWAQNKIKIKKKEKKEEEEVDIDLKDPEV